MSNSPLVDYTLISPNKTKNRTHKIDTITPHCVVGRVSVEALGSLFAKSSRKASSNYGIGYDGRIGMYVEEKDRSWCSSNAANDHRAITIEVASDTTDPYAITDAAYKALVNLCYDICKRNGISELKWKADKSLIGDVSKQNITVHRWFAAKACPGDYIYNRLGQIAAEVNAKLKGNVTTGSTDGDSTESVSLPKVPFTVEVIVDDLNIRSAPSMNGVVNGQTGEGVFTIIEVNDGWGKLKSGAGWIWLENESYCKIQNGVSDANGKEFQVAIDVSNLNIRLGPGTNYAKVGPYIAEGVYTVVEVQQGSGSDSGWGKLKSGVGWISLDYATKL